MIDDTPYLIVDNLKLAPVSRIRRFEPNFRERTFTPRQTMGIVDRVTISKEARQLAACMSVDGAILPEPDSLVPACRPPVREQTPLLTYSRNLSK